MFFHVKIFVKQIKIILKCSLFTHSSFFFFLDFNDPSFFKFIKIFIMLLLQLDVESLLIFKLNSKIVNHLIHTFFILYRLVSCFFIQLLKYSRLFTQNFRFTSFCLDQIFISLMIISEHFNLVSHLSRLNAHFIKLTFHFKVFFVKSNSFFFGFNKSLFLQIKHVSVLFELSFTLIKVSSFNFTFSFIIFFKFFNVCFCFSFKS